MVAGAGAVPGEGEGEGVLTALRVGAHSGARPTVPCAHETTGRPPAGAGRVGMNTMPLDTVGRPRKSSDRYSTRSDRPPGTVTPRGSVRMMSPGRPGGRGLGGV